MRQVELSAVTVFNYWNILGRVKNSSGQVDFYWPLVLDKWLRKKFDHPWKSLFHLLIWQSKPPNQKIKKAFHSQIRLILAASKLF